MRLIFALGLLLFSLTSYSQNMRYSYVAHPDSVLNVLVGQRGTLYKKWAQDQKERNAFFGGQSKKDLRNIIETLENILAKDNEILAELNRMKQGEVAELRRRNSDVAQKANSYLGESGALMEENKLLRRDLENYRKRVKELDEQHNLPLQITIALLVLSWILFFFLRKKRTSSELR
ncbi:hypothetical protein [Siphonobacter sp. SORGH_AS_1065]|uniref:hypothetical protein n=1 Tax=Siphonobacter sp. SORGH_AS_1065 TaxID=3041795 RepID=UPI00278149C0|nr:hypothetical protein [Siphonobacter sp. SORGH_AS_1065]MDQ1088067.1 putative RNase H-like nuclease (RuvC/YqgF family) [Siphonobacter sp. SORGH_AS_1065]